MVVKNSIFSLVTVPSFVLIFSTNLSFAPALTLVSLTKVVYPPAAPRPASQLSDILPVHLPILLLYVLSLAPAELNFTTARFLCCPTSISPSES